MHAHVDKYVVWFSLTHTIAQRERRRKNLARILVNCFSKERGPPSSPLLTQQAIILEYFEYEFRVVNFVRNENKHGAVSEAKLFSLEGFSICSIL